MGNVGRYIIPKTEKDFFTIYTQILSKGETYYDIAHPTCIVHMQKDYRGLKSGQKIFAFYGNELFDDALFLLGFCLDNGHRVKQAYHSFIKMLDAPIDIFYVAGNESDYRYFPGDSLCILDDPSAYEDIDFTWPSNQTDFLTKNDLNKYFEETTVPANQQIDNILKDYIYETNWKKCS